LKSKTGLWTKKTYSEVKSKKGIPIEIIDKAILKINHKGKECFIEAQGRTFASFLKF